MTPAFEDACARLNHDLQEPLREGRYGEWLLRILTHLGAAGLHEVVATVPEGARERPFEVVGTFELEWGEETLTVWGFWIGELYLGRIGGVPVVAHRDEAPVVYWRKRPPPPSPAVGDLDAGAPNHHDHARRGFRPR